MKPKQECLEHNNEVNIPVY